MNTASPPTTPDTTEEDEAAVGINRLRSRFSKGDKAPLQIKSLHLFRTYQRRWLGVSLTRWNKSTLRKCSRRRRTYTLLGVRTRSRGSRSTPCGRSSGRTLSASRKCSCDPSSVWRNRRRIWSEWSTWGRSCCPGRWIFCQGCRSPSHGGTSERSWVSPWQLRSNRFLS